MPVNLPSGTPKHPYMDVDIEPSWKQELSGEFGKPYFLELAAFLKAEKKLQKVIYPPGPQIFNAFKFTPFHLVKVVVIGQDPYYNPGQAHGLSFSVAEGVPVPKSLINIYQELRNDLGITPPKSGNLEKWARQGVLLLNASLTVEAERPNSHSGMGWQTFTDEVIRQLSQKREHLVFLLWGRFAQQKEALIDVSKHTVLKSAHPSPLSAHNGFFGCKHFSLTNKSLVEFGQSPIDWNLND